MFLLEVKIVMFTKAINMIVVVFGLTRIPNNFVSDLPIYKALLFDLYWMLLQEIHHVHFDSILVEDDFAKRYLNV